VHNKKVTISFSEKKHHRIHWIYMATIRILLLIITTTATTTTTTTTTVMLPLSLLSEPCRALLFCCQCLVDEEELSFH